MNGRKRKGLDFSFFVRRAMFFLLQPRGVGKKGRRGRKLRVSGIFLNVAEGVCGWTKWRWEGGRGGGGKKKVL